MKGTFPILLLIIYLLSSGCSTEPEWITVRNKVTVYIDLKSIRDEFRYDSLSLEINSFEFGSKTVDSTFIDTTFLSFGNDTLIIASAFPKEGQVIRIEARTYYENHVLSEIDTSLTLPSAPLDTSLFWPSGGHLDTLLILPPGSVALYQAFTKESCISEVDSSYCVDFWADSVPSPVLTTRIKQFGFKDSLYKQILTFDFASNDLIVPELHYDNKRTDTIGGISLGTCINLDDETEEWCLKGTPREHDVRDYELSEIVVNGLYDTTSFPFKLNIFKEETSPYLPTIDGIAIPLGADFYPIRLDSLIYDEQHPYDSLTVTIEFTKDNVLEYDTLLLKSGTLLLSTIDKNKTDFVRVKIKVENSFGRSDTKDFPVEVYNNASSSLKIDSAYIYNYTIKVGEGFDTLDIANYAYDSQLDSIVDNNLPDKQWKVRWYNTGTISSEFLNFTYLSDDSLLLVTPKKSNWVGSETVDLSIRTVKDQMEIIPIDSLIVSVTFKVESKNVARIGTATQSGEQFPSLNANMAIDGSTDGDLSNGSVTTTNYGIKKKGTKSPWWNLELNDQQFISTITLWNRTDEGKERLNNFVVVVSNKPFETSVDEVSRDIDAITSGQDITAIYDTIPVGQPLIERDSITYMLNRRAQYIRIQMLDTAILQLAEVEVFGVISKEPIIRSDMEYVITTDNSISGPNSSIHIAEQNISDSLLSLAGVTGAESQQWEIKYMDSTVSPKLYNFVNSESGKCLTYDDKESNALVLDCRADNNQESGLQQFKLVTTLVNDAENPERVVYGIETAQQFQTSSTTKGDNTSKIVVSNRRLSIVTEEGDNQGVRFTIPSDTLIDQNILFRAAPRVRY
ncbi:MAG: hypothetical protein OCD01_00925 [Fibrobacterales bacterium]